MEKGNYFEELTGEKNQLFLGIVWKYLPSYQKCCLEKSGVLTLDPKQEKKVKCKDP